jgi:hypothetical protein
VRRTHGPTAVWVRTHFLNFMQFPFCSVLKKKQYMYIHIIFTFENSASRQVLL